MSNVSPQTIVLWISILIKQLLSKLSAFHWFQFPIASVQRRKRYGSEFRAFKTHSHLFPFQKNIGTKSFFLLSDKHNYFFPSFHCLMCIITCTILINIAQWLFINDILSTVCVPLIVIV